MEAKACKEEIFNLLKQNKIPKAIGILDRRIQENKKLSELYSKSIINFAFFHRAEKNFLLGLISWDDYNLSNSKIIESAIHLAENVCSYLGIVRQRELERKALAEKRILWLEWQKNEQAWRTQQVWIQVLDPDEAQRWLKWLERKFPDKNQVVHRQKNAALQDLDSLLDTQKKKHDLALEKIEKSIQSWQNWHNNQEKNLTHVSEAQKNDIQEKIDSGKKRMVHIAALQNSTQKWLTSLNPYKQQEWLLTAEILEPFEWIELAEMLEQLPEEKRQTVLEFLDFSDPFKGRPRVVQWNSKWEEIVMNDDYDYDEGSNRMNDSSYMSPIKLLSESLNAFFKAIDSLENPS